MNADQLLDNYNELQKVQLQNNLKTFTLKELKKEIIKMKADKFAVTKMKRNQIIELIVHYHYLFPHLLTNQGTKWTAKGKQPTVKKQPNAQLINQLINPTYNPATLKQIASLVLAKNTTKPPQQTTTQQNIDSSAPALKGIPLNILNQLFNKSY